MEIALALSLTTSLLLSAAFIYLYAQLEGLKRFKEQLIEKKGSIEEIRTSMYLDELTEVIPEDDQLKDLAADYIRKGLEND